MEHLLGQLFITKHFNFPLDEADPLSDIAGIRSRPLGGGRASRRRRRTRSNTGHSTDGRTTSAVASRSGWFSHTGGGALTAHAPDIREGVADRHTGNAGSAGAAHQRIGTSAEVVFRRLSDERRHHTRVDPAVLPTLASSSLPHLHSFAIDEDGGSMVCQPEPDNGGAAIGTLSLSNSQLMAGGVGQDNGAPLPLPSSMEESEVSRPSASSSHGEGWISGAARNRIITRNSPPPPQGCGAASSAAHKNTGISGPTFSGDRSPRPGYSPAGVSSGTAGGKTFSSAAAAGLRASANGLANANSADGKTSLDGGTSPTTTTVAGGMRGSTIMSSLPHKPPTAPITVPVAAQESGGEDAVPLVHSTTVPVSVLEGQYVLLFLPPPRDVPEGSLPFPTQMSSAATALLSSLTNSGPSTSGGGPGGIGMSEGRMSTTSLHGSVGRSSTLIMKAGGASKSATLGTLNNSNTPVADGGGAAAAVTLPQRSPRAVKDSPPPSAATASPASHVPDSMSGGEGKPLLTVSTAGATSKGPLGVDGLSGRSSPSLNSTLRGPVQPASATVSSMPRASGTRGGVKNGGSSAAQSPVLGCTTATAMGDGNRCSTSKRTEIAAIAAGLSTLLCHQERCTATTRARHKLLTFYNLLMQQLRGEASCESAGEEDEEEDGDESEEMEIHDDDEEPGGGINEWKVAVFSGGVTPEMNSPLEGKPAYTVSTPRHHHRDPAADDLALDVNSSEPSPCEGRRREEEEEDDEEARGQGRASGYRQQHPQQLGRTKGPSTSAASTLLKNGSEGSGAFVRTVQSGGSLGRLSEPEDFFFRRAALHQGGYFAVGAQGTPLNGDTDTGEEEPTQNRQHATTARQRHPASPHDRQGRSRNASPPREGTGLLSFLLPRIAVVEVHYSTTTLLPAVTPAVQSGTTPDGAASIVNASEEKEASVDGDSHPSISACMEREVDRAERAEKTSAKAALICCGAPSSSHTSKSAASMITASSLDWVRATQRLVALSFFHLLFHSSPPPLTLTTTSPALASHGPISSNVHALLCGIGAEGGKENSALPSVAPTSSATKPSGAGGALPSPRSAAPSPTLSTKSLNNSVFLSATTATMGADQSSFHYAALPHERCSGLVDTGMGSPQTSLTAAILPAKLGEDWRTRLRGMAQVRGSCFNIIATSKDVSQTTPSGKVIHSAPSHHHHHQGSRHRRQSGALSGTPAEEANNNPPVSISQPKPRGGTPPPAAHALPAVSGTAGGNGVGTSPSSVSASVSSQTVMNSNSNTRFPAADSHVTLSSMSAPAPTPTNVPNNAPAAVEDSEEYQQQQKTLLRQPPFGFAAGLDESIMRENPFYGGWYSVHSPSAYRRIVRYCDIHSWPAVVLIDPNGEIVTINALEKIEEELRQAVVLTASNRGPPRPTSPLFSSPPLNRDGHASSTEPGDVPLVGSLDGINDFWLDRHATDCRSVSRYVKSHMESLVNEIRELTSSPQQPPQPQYMSGTRRSATAATATNFPSTATSPRQPTTGHPNSVRTSHNVEWSSIAGGVGNMVVNASMDSAGGGALSLNSSICFNAREADGANGGSGVAPVSLNSPARKTANGPETTRTSTVSSLSRPTVNDLSPPLLDEQRGEDAHEPDAIRTDQQGFLETVSVSPSPSAPRNSRGAEEEMGLGINPEMRREEEQEQGTTFTTTVAIDHRRNSANSVGSSRKVDYSTVRHQRCQSSRSDESSRSGALNVVSPVTAIGTGGVLTRASNSTTVTTTAVTSPTASGQFAPCPAFPFPSSGTRPPTVPRSGSSTCTSSPVGSPTRTSVPHFGASADTNAGVASLLQIPPLPPPAPRSSSSACGNTPRQNSYVMISPRIPEESTTAKASSVSPSMTEEEPADMESVWIGMKSSFPWFPSRFASTFACPIGEEEMHISYSSGSRRPKLSKPKKQKENGLSRASRGKEAISQFPEGVTPSLTNKERGGGKGVPQLSDASLCLQGKETRAGEPESHTHDSHTDTVDVERGAPPQIVPSPHAPSGQRSSGLMEEDTGRMSSCLSPFQQSFVADSGGIDYIPSSGASTEHVFIHNGGVGGDDPEGCRSPRRTSPATLTHIAPPTPPAAAAATGVAPNAVPNHSEVPPQSSSIHEVQSPHPAPFPLFNSEPNFVSCDGRPLGTQYWLDQSVRIRTIQRLGEDEKLGDPLSVSTAHPAAPVVPMVNKRLNDPLPRFNSPISPLVDQSPTVVRPLAVPEGDEASEETAATHAMELLRLSTSLSTCLISTAHHQKTMTATSSDILTEEKYIPRNDRRHGPLNLHGTDGEVRTFSHQPGLCREYSVDNETRGTHARTHDNDDDDSNNDSGTSSPPPHGVHSCNNTQGCKCSEDDESHLQGSRGHSAGDDETVAPNDETICHGRLTQSGGVCGPRHSRRATNMTRANADDNAERREKSLSASSLSPASFTISSVGSALQIPGFHDHEGSPESGAHSCDLPGRSTRERTQPARERLEMELDLPTSLMARADSAPRVSSDIRSTEAVKNAFVAAIRPAASALHRVENRNETPEQDRNIFSESQAHYSDAALQLVTPVEDSFYTEANGGSLPPPTHVLFFFGASWHPGMNDTVAKVASLTNRLHGIQKIKKTHHSHKKTSPSSEIDSSNAPRGNRNHTKIKQKKKTKQKLARRRSLHQPFSSDEGDFDGSSLNASHGADQQRSSSLLPHSVLLDDSSKGNQDWRMQPLSEEQDKDENESFSRIANKGFSLNANMDGGDSVLSKALAAAALSGFSAFQAEGFCEDEASGEPMEQSDSQDHEKTSRSNDSSSHSISSSSSSSDSPDLEPTNSKNDKSKRSSSRRSENENKRNGNHSHHKHNKTNNPHGNMKDVDEGLYNTLVTPPAPAEHPSEPGEVDLLSESLFKSFGADVMEESLLDEEEENENDDTATEKREYAMPLNQRNLRMSLQRNPIAENAEARTSEGTEAKSQQKRKKPHSRSTSSDSDTTTTTTSSSSREEEEEEEGNEELSESSVSFHSPFNQTSHFSEVEAVENVNKAISAYNLSSGMNAIDSQKRQNKNSKNTEAPGGDDDNSHDGSETRTMSGEASSENPPSSSSSSSRPDRKKQKQLRREMKLKAKEERAMKREQRLRDKKRMKEQEEDVVERKCMVQWASSPIRVQVIFISMDDSYESLQKSVAKMPKSWRCVSPFVFPRWREWVHSDGQALICQGVLQTTSSMTVDAPSVTPFSSMQFFLIPNSLSVSQYSPQSPEKVVDDAASILPDKRSEFSGIAGISHPAPGPTAPTVSPPAQLPPSRRRTNLLTRSSPLFTLPIALGRGSAATLHSFSGPFRIPVGLSSPSFGFGSPSTFHQFSSLQTLTMPEEDAIEGEVERSKRDPPACRHTDARGEGAADSNEVEHTRCDMDKNKLLMKESSEGQSMAFVHWSTTPHSGIQKEIESLQSQYHVRNLPRLLVMMPSDMATVNCHAMPTEPTGSPTAVEWHVVQKHAEREIQFDEKGKRFPWGIEQYNLVEVEVESREMLEEEPNVNPTEKEKASEVCKENSADKKADCEEKPSESGNGHKRPAGNGKKATACKKKRSKRAVTKTKEQTCSDKNEEESGNDEDNKEADNMEESHNAEDTVKEQELLAATTRSKKSENRRVAASRLWSTDGYNLFRSVTTTTPACMLAYAFQYFSAVRKAADPSLIRPAVPVDYLEWHRNKSAAFFAVVEPLKPFSLQPGEVVSAIFSSASSGQKKGKKEKKRGKLLKGLQSIHGAGSTSPNSPAAPCMLSTLLGAVGSVQFGSAESIRSPAGQKPRKQRGKKNTGSPPRWDWTCLPEDDESIHLQLRPFVDGSTCVLLCAFGEVPHDVHAESIKVMKQVEVWLRERMEERRNRIFSVQIPSLFFSPPSVNLRKRSRSKSNAKEHFQTSPSRCESPAVSKMGSTSMLAIGSSIVARHSNGSSTIFSGGAGATMTSTSESVPVPSCLPISASALDQTPGFVNTNTPPSTGVEVVAAAVDESPEEEDNEVADGKTSPPKPKQITGNMLATPREASSSFPLKDRPFPRVVMLDTIWTSDLALYAEVSEPTENTTAASQETPPQQVKEDIAIVEDTSTAEKKKKKKTKKKKKAVSKKKAKKKAKGNKGCQHRYSSSCSDSSSSSTSSCSSSDSDLEASDVTENWGSCSHGIADDKISGSGKTKLNEAGSKKKEENMNSNTPSLIRQHRREVEALQEYLYGPFLQQHDISTSPPRPGEVFLIVLTGVPSRRKIHVWRRSEKESCITSGTGGVSSGSSNSTTGSTFGNNAVGDAATPVSSNAGLSTSSASSTGSGVSGARVSSAEPGVNVPVYPVNRPLVSPSGGSAVGGSAGAGGGGGGGLMEAALLRRSVSPPLAGGGSGGGPPIRHATGHSPATGSPSAMSSRMVHLSSPPLAVSSSAPMVGVGTPLLGGGPKRRGEMPLLSPRPMSPVLLSSSATGGPRGVGNSGVVGPLPDSPRMVPPQGFGAPTLGNDIEGFSSNAPTPPSASTAATHGQNAPAMESPSKGYRLPLPLEPILCFLSSHVLGEENTQNIRI